MKKILLSMLMLVAMLPAFAADPDYTVTFSYSSLLVTGTKLAAASEVKVASTDDIISSVSKVSYVYGGSDHSSIRLGNKVVNYYKGSIALSLSKELCIDKVIVTGSDYSNDGCELSVNSSAGQQISNSPLEFSIDNWASSITLESTKRCYINSIEIYIKQVDAEFTFGSNPYTMYLSDFVDGVSYESNSFSCVHGDNTLDSYSFSSKNESVATVDNNGEVVPHSIGSTEIVLSIPESRQYFAGDFPYTLNVELIRPAEDGSTTHAPLVYQTNSDGNEELMANGSMNDLTADVFKFHFVTGSTIYYRFSNVYYATTPADAEDEEESDTENNGFKVMSSTDDGTLTIGTIDRTKTADEDKDTTTLEVYAVKDGVQSNSIFLNFSTPTSVEEISVDNNAEAAYYTLQGVRVANPEKGLYIRVRGSKADKVIF
jgi:hypothetical protein